MARPSLEDNAAVPIDGTGVEAHQHVQHPQSRHASPPVPHGIKRAADVDNSACDHEPKRPKTTQAPPIWAQVKRGLPPMKKRSQLQPNGYKSRQIKPSQASTESQPAPVPHKQPRAQVSYNSILDDSYERSFRDVVPTEDLNYQIADFIYRRVVQANPGLPLEIEAKVGRIVEKGSNERLRLALQNEVILGPEYNIAFESQMTEANHKFMNEYLNESVLLSHKPRTSDGKPRINIQYIHHREADAFYDLPPAEISKLDPMVTQFLQSSARSSHNPKIRVTRDLRTGEVIAKVIKARIDDRNVFCPNWQFDWRVSVSVEFPWDGSVEALEEYAASQKVRRGPSRNKDRLSYTHQFCRVDLTQVKVGVQAGGGFDSISHELEVEMDVPTVRNEGQLVGRGQPNHYSEYVKVFVDNVRLLAKNMPRD
ncbi:MAG: hypothetical protein Q9162_000267 [Coniocarpon cinnabarinum]